MTFKPRHDRILIKPDKDIDKVGDFHLLGKEVEKSRQGEVIAVGPGLVNHKIELKISGETSPELLDRVENLIRLIREPVPTDVKVGDRVLFGQYSGTRVTLEEVEYLMIRETDVMLVL